MTWPSSFWVQISSPKILVGPYLNIILILNCASFRRSMCWQNVSKAVEIYLDSWLISPGKPLMIKAHFDSFQNKSDLFKSFCVWRSTVKLKCWLKVQTKTRMIYEQLVSFRCLDYVLDEIEQNKKANVMVASHNIDTVKHTLRR